MTCGSASAVSIYQRLFDRLADDAMRPGHPRCSPKEHRTGCEGLLTRAEAYGLIAREGKGKAGCVARHLRHLREIIAERKGHNVVTSTINARPPAHGERRDKQG